MRQLQRLQRRSDADDDFIAMCVFVALLAVAAFYQSSVSGHHLDDSGMRVYC